jgi:hypothetical protein
LVRPRNIACTAFLNVSALSEPAFDGGLARARIASGNGFFPALAQATLETIPAATDSNRAVADYD